MQKAAIQYSVMQNKNAVRCDSAIGKYYKFGKDCVLLIFVFFAFSLGRKIEIRND